MRWGAHIAIGIGIGAAIEPLAIPAAVIGATAPDWIEYILRAVGRPVRHRTVTHVCAYWLALIAVFWLAGVGGVEWGGRAFGFALGGASHVFADACTVSGVPFWPWSTRRFHLFGGRLRTGQPAEIMIAAAVLAGGIGLGVLLHSGGGGGYLPFFPDYADKYTRGVIDASEWRAHRFRLL